MRASTLFSSLAMTVGAFGAPIVDSALETRAVVNHDSLNPVPTRLGPNGRVIEMFAPLLHVAHGCQPYTAVDDAGNTSGGLQDTGSVGAGCRDTGKGQLYARAAAHKDRFAIMYAYYFPKDQPVSGNVAGGHRHDWESIVVYIDSATAATPRLISAGASGHGEYKVTGNPQRSGTNVKAEYFHVFPRNQELQFTDTQGRAYPINDWDAMPAAAKDALQNTLFGAANVPFKDGNFVGNLDRAWLA